MMDIGTLGILTSIINTLSLIIIYFYAKLNDIIQGTKWWVIGNACTSMGVFLLIRQDIISIRLISMIIGNGLIVLGVVFIYIGIMQFLENQVKQWYIISSFAVFTIIFVYFTYVRNDITMRTIVFSIIIAIYLLLSAQGLLRNNNRSMKTATTLLSGILLIQGCFFVVRAIMTFMSVSVDNLFDPSSLWMSTYTTSIITSYLTTFGLILMVMQKLNSETKVAKERLQLIFDTSPDAVFISSLQSGRIVEVNEKFVVLTGFSREEAIGETTTSLGLWSNLEDRAKFVAELKENRHCENFEMVVRIKNGSLITALISAKLMDLDGIPHLISITRNITERKRAEESLRRSEERYRVLAETIKDIIWILDAETLRYVYVSPSIYNLSGFTPEEIILEPLERTLGSEGADYVKRIVRQRVGEFISGKQSSSSKHYIDEFEQLCKDGSKVWTEAIMTYYINKETDRVEIRGVTRDISERKAVEQKLKQSEEKYRLLIENARESIIVVQDGRMKFCNPLATEVTGYSQDELTSVAFIEFIHPDDREIVVSRHLQRLKGELIENLYHFRVISKDHQIKWVEMNSVLIEWDGRAATLNLLSEITQRKKSEEEILHLSYHDQLTGLYNRRFYEEEFKRLNTERNLPLTIVIGDVNGLKLINDSFGHAMGDELLKKAAEVIKKGCRADDIIARLGGDEFVMILPKTDSFETEKIIKRIKDLSAKEKVGSINISISFGYETKINKEVTIQELFKKAEDLMYKNKMFESPSMRGRTINVIMRTLYEKNKREEQHSHRVSLLCKSIGEALNLSEGKIEELKTVGLLHDIGKIALDEKVLNKPGKLTEDEFNEIKHHPEIGYRILSTINDMADLANYVLFHHEQWNGQGYPKGLKGDEIPFVSRIITIADAYDAMTSDRSYRSALPKDVVIAELQKNSGIQFDPELLGVFIEKVLGLGLNDTFSPVTSSGIGDREEKPLND